MAALYYLFTDKAYFESVYKDAFGLDDEVVDAMVKTFNGKGVVFSLPAGADVDALRSDNKLKIKTHAEARAYVTTETYVCWYKDAGSAALKGMTKDELLVNAGVLGLSVTSANTKQEIKDAITAEKTLI